MDAPLLLVAEKCRYGFNLRVGQIMRVGPLASVGLLPVADRKTTPQKVVFPTPALPPS